MSGILLSPGMKFVSYDKSVRCSLGLFPQPFYCKLPESTMKLTLQWWYHFFWLRNRICHI